MSNLKQAEKLYSKALNAENALKDKMSDFEREQLYEAKKQINAEAEKRWGADLKQLQETRVEAHRQLVIEQDEATLQAKPPYPLGAIFAEWKKERFAARTQPPKLTGRKAVFEVVTSSTQFPDNWASYSKPEIGQYILRVLKKDGTPGKQVIVTTHGKAYNWLPEGEAPRP